MPSRETASTGESAAPSTVAHRLPAFEGPEPDLRWVDRRAEFVGRSPELRTLKAFLDRVAHGHGGVQLVQGEAGIGKTRFLSEVGKIAREAGFDTLLTVCDDRDRNVPYGPWIDLARQSLIDLSRVRIARAVQPRRSLLVQWFPPFGDQFWLYAPESVAATTIDRRQYLTTLAEYFVGLSDGSPLLLLIDDLGVADRSTIDLLETVAELARTRPVAVLGTARTEHLAENAALQAALLRLLKAGSAGSLTLPPMSRSDFGRFTEQLLGREPLRGGLRSLLYESSGGNPLFAEEVLRSLVATGDVVRSSSGWAQRRAGPFPVTSSVQFLIAKRVSDIDPGPANVLRVASLLAREFSPELLEAVSGEPEPMVTTALESGLRLRLLEERSRPDGTSVVAFRHPLFREAIASQVSTAHARRIHHRAAAELRRTLGDRTETEAATLAYHYLQAGDTHEALTYSLTAAEHAASAFARSEAIAHWQVAVRLLSEPEDRAARARVRERLARQLTFLADWSSAIAEYDAATDDYLAAGDRVSAAGSLIPTARFEELPLAEQRRRADRARALLRGVRSGRVLARWYSLQGLILYCSATGAEALRASQRGLELAEADGDPETIAEALIALAGVVPYDRYDLGLQLVERAQQLADGHQLARIQDLIHWERALIHLVGRGDYRQFDRIAGDSLDHALRTTDVDREQVWEGLGFPFVSLRMGNLTAAYDAAVALERRQELALTGRRLDPLGVIATVAALRGDLDEAERSLREMWKDSRRIGDWEWYPMGWAVEARVRLRQGRTREACALLERARDRYATSGPVLSQTLNQAEILLLLARAYFADRRPERGRTAVRELARYATAAGGEVARAFAERGEAEAALHAARPSSRRARDLLARTLEVFERYGWKFETATIRARLERLLRDAGEREAADALGKEVRAYAASEHLDLARWDGRALELLPRRPPAGRSRGGPVASR